MSMESPASTGALRIRQHQHLYKDEQASNVVHELVHARDAEDSFAEEASASFDPLHEVCAMHRSRNLLSEPQLPMALIDRDAKMQNDGVTSTSSELAPGQLTCLDLSLKLPLCLGESNHHKRSSESFINPKLRSPCGLLESEEISKFSRSCPTSLSAEFSACQENNLGGLHLSPEESEDTKGGNEVVNVRERGYAHQSSGIPCGFAPYNLSPNQRSTSIPGSLSLALPQKTFSVSEFAYVQNPLYAVTNVISPVDSSEWGNLRADITAGTATKEPSLKLGESCHRSEEIDAMIEADECKEQGTILTLVVDTAEGPTEVKSDGCGALDLLLTAIQVTSGGMFGTENDVQVFENVDLVHSGAREVYCLYGRSPIVKKRVIRRARNAFKKLHGGNLLQNARRFEVPDVVTEVPSGRRKKRVREKHVDAEIEGGFQRSQNKHGRFQESHVKDGRLQVSLMKEGRFQASHMESAGFQGSQVKDVDPVVRSKRGRSQVLPTKFSDSVLQPWKRKSRRELNGKFHIP